MLKNFTHCKTYWKFIAAVLIGCMVFSIVSIHVHAENNKVKMTPYVLEDVGIQISLPINFYTAFTRDIEENDPWLRASGITKEDVENMMLSEDCYFYAVGYGKYIKVFVSDYAHETKDYRFMDDEEILEICRYMGWMDTEKSDLTKEPRIYTTEQSKYIVLKHNIEFDIEQITYYGLEYMTVYDGKVFSVQGAYSQDNTLDFAEEQTQMIVDSLKFTTDLDDVKVETDEREMDESDESIQREREEKKASKKTSEKTSEQTYNYDSIRDSYYRSYQLGYQLGRFIISISIGMICFFVILFFPLFLYRLCKKHSIPREKAKKITYIYSCILFVITVLFAFIIGNLTLLLSFSASILLWAFAGFMVLQAGHSDEPTKGGNSDSQVSAT